MNNTLRLQLPCPLLLLLILSAATLRAQENRHVQWMVLTPEVAAVPGRTIMVKVRAVIAGGSHMYTTKKYPNADMAPQTTEVTAGDSALVSLGGNIKVDRASVKKYDENYELDVEYWDGAVTFTIPVKIAKDARPGQGWVNFRFMTCDDKACMPPSDKKLPFNVRIKKR